MFHFILVAGGPQTSQHPFITPVQPHAYRPSFIRQSIEVVCHVQVFAAAVRGFLCSRKSID